MEILKLEPFSAFTTGVPEIPALVQEYLDAADILTGQNFRLVNDGKGENTGDGMSYYNRLRIFYKEESKPIFDSGFQLYRPGYAFSTDRWDLCINDVKLLREEGDTAVYGYQDGLGKVFVKRCHKNGTDHLTSFDLAARRKAIANQDEPKDIKKFESWVGRQLPEIGGGGWHYGAYHDDDIQSVVIARHCNRSVDATHDAFKVFVWKKGEGVAVSELYYTHAKNSYYKFFTNYLKGQVSITDHGDIIYKAKSEFGDITVEKIFSV